MSRPRSSSRPFVSPIQPHNWPNALPGDVNGEVPSRQLVGVAPNCVAARPAAPSLALLLATARDEGVPLDTVECYRPLSGQVAVKQKWTSLGKSACAAPLHTSSTGKVVGTSMHGWGEATDFGNPAGTLTFGSAGYRFLKAHAWQFGWNHPAWAEPGGSVCPEPWHWEWVGDGGALRDSRVVADVVSLVPTPDGFGYSVVTGLGAVRASGDAVDEGSMERDALPWLIAAACPSPDGGGYWLVAGDGSVYGFGEARTFGSLPRRRSTAPVVGIAAAANGDGYWLATSDGHVFAFGSAASLGSPASSRTHLARPVVAIASTPDGGGYWLATADGRVFSYGDAALHGSVKGRTAPSPVVSMAVTSDGRGYWLVRADGHVQGFGDATAFGSVPRRSLREPVTAMAAMPHGAGYWVVAADGAVFAFGHAAIFRPAADAHAARSTARAR